MLTQCYGNDCFYKSSQGVEKRYERRQDKIKFDEKAEFISINEHFEENFNAVLASAIVFQQTDKGKCNG